MDRNQFIGLILMLVLITVYFQFFAPEVPVPQEVDNQVAQPIIQDSLANPTATSSPDASILSDSAIDKLNQMKYGLFSLAAQGTDEELLVENESMKISFSSKGGQVSTVELKNYKKFNGEPLVLITKEHNINVYFEHLSRRISLNDLYFTPSVKKYQDSTQIIY
ncbi:MAG: membrane protein insertase YidC, partial [Cyclobacteriaceae bacterium]|nr:membrane protein insertase YidC [Cyclobacteriaceae bacterium]